jgi:hypothetical protein
MRNKYEPGELSRYSRSDGLDGRGIGVRFPAGSDTSIPPYVFITLCLIN